MNKIQFYFNDRPLSSTLSPRLAKDLIPIFRDSGFLAVDGIDDGFVRLYSGKGEE